jgi:hypothetical protein
MTEQEARAYARYTTEQLESLLKQSDDTQVSRSIAQELARRYRENYEKVAEKVRRDTKFASLDSGAEDDAQGRSSKSKKGKSKRGSIGRIILLVILLIAVAMLAALYEETHYHRDTSGEVHGS